MFEKKISEEQKKKMEKETKRSLKKEKKEKGAESKLLSVVGNCFTSFICRYCGMCNLSCYATESCAE